MQIQFLLMQDMFFDKPWTELNSKLFLAVHVRGTEKRWLYFPYPNLSLQPVAVMDWDFIQIRHVSLHNSVCTDAFSEDLAPPLNNSFQCLTIRENQLSPPYVWHFLFPTLGKETGATASTPSQYDWLTGDRYCFNSDFAMFTLATFLIVKNKGESSRIWQRFSPARSLNVFGKLIQYCPPPILKKKVLQMKDNMKI